VNPVSSSNNNGGRPVKSLIKALRILDVLGDSEGGLGVTVLSHALKAPKSTVHRLLATLKAEGYIGIHPGTSRYILGSRVAKWGDQLCNQSPLLRFGAPMLERLTQESGETSYLAMLEGIEVALLAREESKGFLRISIGMGYRTPAHCTALGKACLSCLSDAEILKLYKNKRKLQQFTPNTITNIEDLLAELAAVRRDGIAFDDEEYVADVRCISASIKDPAMRVLAAVTIATTKRRMTAERRAFFKGILLQASSELSEKLGYRRIG